jgi:ABC-2 type transport system permease protein
MTATTNPVDTRDHTAGRRAGDGEAAGSDVAGITPGRVLLSEWIKLRSLRSTYVILAAAALAIIGFGVFMAVGTVVADTPPAEGADPLGGSLYGIALAELIVAALGVLSVTGEYASGVIRTWLPAVPRRWPLLLAKAGVVATTVFVVSLGATLLAFLGAALVLAGNGRSLSVTEPGVLRALIGAALYLAAVALLGMGFGWLLRSTAGALATLLAVLYVPPVLGILLPRDLGDHVMPYVPSNAGSAVMQLTPSGLLQPWAGFAVFLGYAALTLAAGAIVLQRRDA